MSLLIIDYVHPNRYTIDDILALKSCWGNDSYGVYSDDLARRAILKVWPDGQDTVTARDILDESRVDDDDTVWLLCELLPVPQFRLFLCWCAEQHLAKIPEVDQDSRVTDIIAVVRRYVDGNATNEELKDAEAAAAVSVWLATRIAVWVGPGVDVWAASDSMADAKVAAKAAVWAAVWAAGDSRTDASDSRTDASDSMTDTSDSINELVRLHERLE